MPVDRKRESRISILTYHSIDNTGSIISTTPNKFRAHMQHLKNTASNVISLSEIVSSIRKNRPLPPKSVAITFDDGFKNFHHIAYPIIKEFEFTATVFLVPGYCGKANKWNKLPKGIPSIDLMNWNEIVELAKSGIDFGAHTVNHPNLSKLPFDSTVQEIVDSKSMIETHLGKDVLFFAYPYGRFNHKIKSIVEGEFFGACSTNLGFVSSKSDIYLLPRVEMYYFSRNNLFRYFGTFFFHLYITFRSLLRSLRSS